MKKNLILALTVALSVISCALGVLTKFFTNDILQYAVYGIVALSAVFSLVIYFTGNRKQLANAQEVYSGRLFALPCFALAMLQFCEGGFYFGKWIKYMDTYQPMKSFDWLIPLALLSGIFFAVSAFEFISLKRSFLSKLFGVFAPIFICARAISMFFESFKTPADFGVKIQMVAMCVAALVVMIVCALTAGAGVAVRRVKAVTLLFCSVSAAVAIPELAEVIVSFGENITFENLLWNLQLIILWVFAFFILIKSFGENSVLTEREPEVQIEQQSALDVYISDIPEEKEDEE